MIVYWLLLLQQKTSVKKEKRQFPNLLSLQDNWNGNWKKIIFFASILEIENFVIKMEENMKVNFKKMVFNLLEECQFCKKLFSLESVCKPIFSSR